MPEYPVCAFGSRAKWLAKSYSDLDLALMTTVPLSLARMADIKEAFAESDLTVRVDVLDWAATDQKFQEMIAKDMVIIAQPFATNSRQSWMTWRLGEVGRLVSADFAAIPTHAVLVCCSGTDAGRVALAANPCLLNGQVVAIIINPDKWSHEFIYYSLLSRQDEIRLLVADRAQPMASKSALSSLWVSCPALAEQNRVVNILRLPDQRIALLHETNTTLEAMLETLFSDGQHQQLATLLRQRVQRNAQQATLTTTLRDTLLPRLISGQLRLPEVQAHSSIQ